MVMTGWPPQPANDRDRNQFEEISLIVDGRNFIRMSNFNSRIDWNTRQVSAKGMPLIEFVTENFLVQWFREPIRDKDIHDIVLITKDDIVEDVSIGK